MKAVLTVLLLMLTPTSAFASPPPDECALRMTENGKFVSFQGIVDASSWSHGTYEMSLEARQGGNLSLSRQAGKFDGTTMKSEGFIVLSGSTVYVSDDSKVNIELVVKDGTKQVSCSLDYNR